MRARRGQPRWRAWLRAAAKPTSNRIALAAIWCAYVAAAYLLLLAASDAGLAAFTRWRHPPASKFAALRESNAKRHHLFYDFQRMPAPPQVLRERSRMAPPSFEQNLRLAAEKLARFDEGDFGLARECAAMSQLEKLEDPYCRAAWSHGLQYSAVASVRTLYSFTSDRLASFVVTLENGMRAMYKPCAGGHEFPECEVISYYLDLALGFNRVSPIVLRNITVDSMREVVRRERRHMLPGTYWELETLDQLEQTCAEDGVMHGAMIGWWDDVQPARTVPKKKRFGKPDTTGMTDAALADMSQNHYFCYLLQLLREPGKNEFRQSSGELLMIDMDRAQYYFFTSAETYGLALCKLCRFSHELWQLADALAQADQQALWGTLALHLAEDLDRPLVLDERKMNILSSRVASVAKCMRECIRRDGAAVFVDT